jgi:hypothetical protein
MTGKNKRSVEADYRFYDPPEIILAKIRHPIEYRRARDRLEVRDLALGSLIYMTTARITEIVGGPVKVGILPGITPENFVEDQAFLKVRNLPVIKQKFFLRGDQWIQINGPEDYPRRVEIPLPKAGGLSIFTKYIARHLENVKPGEPVFNISSTRGYTIIKDRTGEFPHYLRDMGLKLWYRLFSRDPFKLKEFSGHKRWENLERYMKELATEDYSRVLNYSMGPGDIKPLREFIA